MSSGERTLRSGDRRPFGGDETFWQLRPGTGFWATVVEDARFRIRHYEGDSWVRLTEMPGAMSADAYVLAQSIVRESAPGP